MYDRRSWTNLSVSVLEEVRERGLILSQWAQDQPTLSWPPLFPAEKHEYFLCQSETTHMRTHTPNGTFSWEPLCVSSKIFQSQEGTPAVDHESYEKELSWRPSVNTGSPLLSLALLLLAKRIPVLFRQPPQPTPNKGLLIGPDQRFSKGSAVSLQALVSLWDFLVVMMMGALQIFGELEWGLEFLIFAITKLWPESHKTFKCSTE